MQAPLILLQSSVADDLPLFTLDKSLVVSGFWTSAIPQGYSNTVEILASGKVPGMLEPGESVTVPVYYAGMQQPWNFSEGQFKFDLRIFTSGDIDDVDWTGLQSTLQPAGISDSAWAPVYQNLASQLVELGPPVYQAIANEAGPVNAADVQEIISDQIGTWGGYVKLLDNEASYLGQLGEDVTDVSQLWDFAVQQAGAALSPVGPTLASATDDSVVTPGNLSLSFSRVFAESIDGRNTMGPLGLGWSTPWQTTATTAADGTVTITGADGAQRIFEPDSRAVGAFFSQPGDTGTLTTDGLGGYLLTEADGTATDYNPDGTLNYVQDTNGNRITAGYTAGLLTSLTASSGASITIAYNAAGLISTVYDSQGRDTTYTYDSSNQHLIAVTGFNGQTTRYTYDTDPDDNAFNALTSITFPGGTHQYFTYDSEGRLASTSNDGGAQTQSYTYALGEVSITDGTGDTSHLYYNEQGLVVKTVDPLGNVTLNAYDSNFNLTSVTNALGQSETYTYNAAGEVTSSTDFLGNTTYFSYAGPFNDLASMTDANGNTTSYAYSSAGDLLTTTYANGTSETNTYDPEGNATSFLNANGQPIQYTYNAAGQMTTESFSDGSAYTYTYDSLGDLLTATDATGTTTFIYAPTTELLTKVAYPNGTSLAFTYNAAGQRTSMVDQTGFTVNYAYDAVGRLSDLTDANGNLIVTYTYDADGRLSEQTDGNGTYTTYQYDADGNILHLVNYAPGGTINSRFDYTYNLLGLETSEATLYGTWTYTYDVDGQLIGAVFASTNSTVPSQDLAYTYDAMGNRITTVINGVTTAYSTNDMNEYTSVGGVADTYDADGNLTSDGTNTYTYNSLNQLIGVTGPSGTTTYTYNALGQRVASTTNGQTTQCLIDPSGFGDVVAEFDGSGNLIASYNQGYGLISQSNAAGNSSYYAFSAGGSTSELTNAAGAVLNSYTYDPFGLTLANPEVVANLFAFAGEYGVTNEGNGLEFMRARYYSPTLGRFLQSDPIGINGGYNEYTYSTNDPVSSGDASGLVDVSDLAPISTKLPSPEDAAKDLIGILLGHTILGVAIDLWNGSRDAAVLLGTLLFVPPDQPHPYYYYPGSNLIPPSNFWTPSPLPQVPSNYQPYNIPFTNNLLDPTPVLPNGPPAITTLVRSMDPNSLIGPAGYGASDFVALTGAVFPYEIDFENAPSATAPAQVVTITDQLDPNLDWSTFQLTGIGWGDTILSIPAGSQYYEATVPVTYNGQTFDVEVEAGIHTSTGQVYATFQSIDPNTQLPPDVLTGFLPPEDGTGRGMGYISYIVKPKAGLPTGTQITNVALVTFDANPAIATDQVNDEDPSQGTDPAKMALVTIDAGPPASRVNPLPPTTTASSFTVNMTGTDDTGGSGVGSFALYVSTDGGPFVLDLSDIPAQAGSDGTYTGSTTFAGAQGNTYAFYSAATDNVGNAEAAAAAAQATITVVPQSSLTAVAGAGPYAGTAALTATLVYATTPLAGKLVTFSLVSGSNTMIVGSATTNASGVATLSDVSLAGLSAGTNTGSVVASFAGDATFAATSASGNLVVNPVAPTVTWANPDDIVTGTPLGSAQLDATASVPGTFAYSPAAGTVLDAGQGQTLTMTFTPTDSTDYASATTTAAINVQQATPTLIWANPADITYGTPLAASQLDATASVPGTFAYTPTPGTVLKAGTGQVLSVTFTPIDTVDYTAITTTATINVLNAAPTIVWADPADIVSGTPLSPAQLDAVSSVPGTFVYTPDAGTVLNVGQGQVLSVAFNPADTTDYTSATATATINVMPPNQKSTPILSWANPASIVYGTALSATQLDATAALAGSAVAGTFTYTPAAGIVLNAGTGQPLSVSFTPSDTADFNNATATVLINVAPAPLTVIVNGASRVYGQLNPSFTVSYNGFVNGDMANSLGGTLAFSTEASPASDVGSYDVTASGLSASNYAITYIQGLLTISPAAQTIAWSTPADISYGTSLGAAQLDANVTGAGPAPAGTLAYSPAAGTVLSAGVGQTLTVVAAATFDYNQATFSVPINVQEAAPTIAWADPAGIVPGTPLGPGQLDATASVPGTFVYTPAAGFILNAGPGQTLSVTFTPNDTADYTSLTATAMINVQQAAPTITWADPADITYGTELGAAQLDATASVPGTFAYSPAGGTLLHAGQGENLSVTFTPTDSIDYPTVTVTATINVQQAAPTITWANPADITYGAPLGATQLDATASVAGSFLYTPASGTFLNAGQGQSLSANFTPADPADYSAVTATAQINVAPASLTVTADDESMLYGASVPSLAFNVTGFVNGDTTNVLSGSASLATAATSASGVGTYTITVGPGTLSAANYEFSNLVNGTLTVYPARLTVTADNKSKVYGAADPTLTYTVTGLLNGDAPSVISGVTLSTTTGAAATAGTHPIVTTGGAAANYAISDVNGTLTVTKAPLTAAADNKSKSYGAADPTLTYTITGTFYYGAGPSVVSGVTLSTATGAAATVGTHAITPTGGSAANYTITDVPGTLTVTASTTTPPPLVTMTNVDPVKNKKHLVTQILVNLSGTVNAGEADSLATYRLATAGKKGSFTAKHAQVIKLKSAVYNPATDSVTLTPKKAFALTKPVQLVVDGVPPSGLQDSYGRFIDAGKSATALLRRGGATITGARHAPTDSQRLLLKPAVVDGLLDHQSLHPIAVKHAARAARALRDDTSTSQRRVERAESIVVNRPREPGLR